MPGFVSRPALAGALLLLACSVSAAEDQRQNAPGQFDFYVLSLSWSPSFCEAAGERGTPPQQQCAARPYSFVVHGLCAIRARISGILPSPGPETRSQCRRLDAGYHARAAVDLPAMGEARYLLGTEPERLIRNGSQGARNRQDPAGVHAAH